MPPVLAKFLMALAAFIQPEINYVEQKLASVGAAFLGSMATIGAHFTMDQRAIGVKVIAFWQAKMAEAKAAGASEISAIESASTAAYNEFCAEEGAEFTDFADSVITQLKIAGKNGIAAVEQGINQAVPGATG